MPIHGPAGNVHGNLKTKNAPAAKNNKAKKDNALAARARARARARASNKKLA